MMFTELNLRYLNSYKARCFQQVMYLFHFHAMYAKQTRAEFFE